jgi:hypothetical protein
VLEDLAAEMGGDAFEIRHEQGVRVEDAQEIDRSQAFAEQQQSARFDDVHRLIQTVGENAQGIFKRRSIECYL